MRRLAGGRSDHLGVERPVLVGDVGVERHAWLIAVARVDVGDGLAWAAGEEVLPVGARLGAVAPNLSERQRAVRVDEARKRFRISRLADVPVVDQGELSQARAPAGLRHAGEP